MYNKNIAYNELPFLPPKVDLETKKVLKKVGNVKAALAELKGWMLTQPNPMLLLETLTLQEAKASSEIENIVTTNDEIYQAFISPVIGKYSPAVKEVLYYKNALWSVYPKIVEGYPITVNVMVDLFRIVKKRTDGIRNLSGTRLANKDKDTVYTPPDNYETIMQLLTNLEKYINEENDDMELLIKLAVIHYQFECIHPFPDGNGRVGRLLNVLYLVKNKFIDFPVFYLSRYIMEHKKDYYLNLQKVTESGNWEEWILYMLDAVEITAKDTLAMVQKIYFAWGECAKQVKKDLPGIYSAELIGIIFERPYCKISFLVERGLVKPQTASKYLHTLKDHGFLDCISVGREKYYINNTLLDIIQNG